MVGCITITLPRRHLAQSTDTAKTRNREKLHRSHCLTGKAEILFNTTTSPQNCSATIKDMHYLSMIHQTPRPRQYRAPSLEDPSPTIFDSHTCRESSAYCRIEVLPKTFFLDEQIHCMRIVFGLIEWQQELLLLHNQLSSSSFFPSSWVEYGSSSEEVSHQDRNHGEGQF
jgi:hypothetical protein